MSEPQETPICEILTKLDDTFSGPVDGYLERAAAELLDFEMRVRGEERERILTKLEAFQTSCEGYITKAVWRELDALVVELGGERRPYKFT